MSIEAMPYSTFKERLKIVREELAKDKHAEVWDKVIHTETRGDGHENKQECF